MSFLQSDGGRCDSDGPYQRGVTFVRRLTIRVAYIGPRDAASYSRPVHRFALFAISCVTACGRIGFDERAGLVDGSTNGSDDGAIIGGDGGSDGSGGTGSFGSTEIGISSQNTGQDRVWITRFMLTEPAMVQTIVAHFGVQGGQGALVRGVVYADAANEPAGLIARTNESALAAGAAPSWVTLAFASPLPLSPGAYWLGTHNGSSISVQYQSTMGATKFAGDLYSDGTAAAYATGTTTFAMQLSIYAEYTR
jgi:hypothetical protein